MRIFTVKDFDRFVRKERLNDDSLVAAIELLEHGTADAILGGNLFKQRIARRNEGKSGGFRTIIVFQRGDRAVFVEGYAKNVKKVHSPDELMSLKSLANRILSLSDTQIKEAIDRGGFREIER